MNEPTPQPKGNPNSVAVGNRGPMPDLHDLPLTPERQASKEEVLRQMRDPSSPLGRIGIELGSRRRSRKARRAVSTGPHPMSKNLREIYKGRMSQPNLPTGPAHNPEEVARMRSHVEQLRPDLLKPDASLETLLIP